VGESQRTEESLLVDAARECRHGGLIEEKKKSLLRTAEAGDGEARAAVDREAVRAKELCSGD
jgi:hypothetical protein